MILGNFRSLIELLIGLFWIADEMTLLYIVSLDLTRPVSRIF